MFIKKGSITGRYFLRKAGCIFHFSIKNSIPIFIPVMKDIELLVRLLQMSVFFNQTAVRQVIGIIPI